MKCLCRASPSLAEAEEDKNADGNSSLSSYLVQERNEERFLFLGLSAQVMQDSLLDAPSISGSYNYRLKLKPACKQGNFVASQLLLARSLARQAPRERAETEHWLIWIVELAGWPRERERMRERERANWRLVEHDKCLIKHSLSDRDRRRFSFRLAPFRSLCNQTNLRRRGVFHHFGLEKFELALFLNWWLI